MKKFLLYIWQLPQNIIGFILSRFSKKIFLYDELDKNEIIKVYYTSNVFGCGVSLGNYILLDKKYLGFNHNVTIMHEHGHQKQSRIFGIFYLLIIGIPSACGNLIDRFFHKNWSDEKRNDWYYNKLPWEHSADKLGNVTRSLRRI